ncbi:MAG: hypothetical protein ACI8ZM_002612 [Crocinitomix sp.]|jgi:hypothetical protein
MVLTKEEFCLFNVTSRIKLMKMDGQFLTKRVCEKQYLISLYEIYGFYIETIYDLSQMKTIRIEPIFSSQILDLYPIKQDKHLLN